MVHMSIAQARALGLDVDGVKAEPKYKNKRVVIDGIQFDSQAEARRWGELCLSKFNGLIRDLEVHPRYLLVVNGIKIGVYVADFRYVDVATHQIVVEDVKGGNATKTPVYRLKKKLLFALYLIEIREIMNDARRAGKAKKGRR